jgi:hypothetical protein
MAKQGNMKVTTPSDISRAGTLDCTLVMHDMCQQVGRQAPMEPEKLAQSAPLSAFQSWQCWQLQLAGY